MTLPEVHIVIPTHTTRHLAATLAAIGASENPPRSVVVSVDGDDAGFGAVLAGQRFAPLTTTALVTRPHQGEARLNQVRNNGLRALRDLRPVEPDDFVLVMDGDMALGPRSIGQHVSAAADGCDVVLASRVNLSEDDTKLLSTALCSGDRAEAAAMMDRFWSAGENDLKVRQRRLERQRQMRAWPIVGGMLVKPHKPKLLGGHHSVRRWCMEALNGYDERFVGYGYDDDDLARRLHFRGAGTAVRVDTIQAFHLWHPTRAPQRATDAPGYRVFTETWKPRAALGIDSPSAQPEPEIQIIQKGAATGV